MLNDAVIVIDCQATGASPAHGSLLELGFAVATPNARESAIVRQLLVAQSAPIPKRIATLTGISDSDVANGCSFDEALENLADAIRSLPKPTRLVAHYARFEIPFLSDGLAKFGLSPERDYVWCCTYELARRLYPSLPSRSIRAVSGFLGFPIDACKRSADHVEATISIWREMATCLNENHKVSSWSDLDSFLANSKPEKVAKKTYALRNDIRLTAPSSPGVYLLKNCKGDILYVGKATSLKARVNSYFRGQKTKGSRLNELVSQVTDIETRTAASPLAAAVMETDLIKEIDPPYNRALKRGDRSVVYVNRELKIADPNDAEALLPSTAVSILSTIDAIFCLRAARDCLGEDVVATPEGITAARWLEGIALFEEWYGIPLTRDRATIRRLLARFFVRGILRQRQAREEARLAALEANQADEAENEQEESKEVDMSEEEIVWTAELVAKHIAGLFSSLAATLFRSRWLLRLRNVDIEWRGPRGKRERFSVRNGYSTDPESAAEIGHRDPNDRVQDIATFDRLAVLYTECLRLVQENRGVQMDFGSGIKLDHATVHRLVFPGYFDGDAN